MLIVGWYLAAVILGVLVALMTIYHDQVCLCSRRAWLISDRRMDDTYCQLSEGSASRMDYTYRQVISSTSLTTSHPIRPIIPASLWTRGTSVNVSGLTIDRCHPSRSRMGSMGRIRNRMSTHLFPLTIGLGRNVPRRGTPLLQSALTSVRKLLRVQVLPKRYCDQV